jgi:hypothetical protein
MARRKVISCPHHHVQSAAAGSYRRYIDGISSALVKHHPTNNLRTAASGLTA